MATCAKCGVPLEPGAAACANCGRIVSSREKTPLWQSWITGIMLMFALWILVGVGSLTTFGGGCNSRWPAIFYTLVIVGCLAALAGGIAAARRGYPARAVVFLVPAIGVLVPAAACSTSVFAAHC